MGNGYNSYNPKKSSIQQWQLLLQGFKFQSRRGVDTRGPRSGICSFPTNNPLTDESGDLERGVKLESGCSFNQDRDILFEGLRLLKGTGRQVLLVLGITQHGKGVQAAAKMALADTRRDERQ